MKRTLFATAFVLFIVCFASITLKANAGTYALKNWQQDEPSVPGYVHDDQTGTWWYKVYGKGTFGDTGCGIMSLVNAVHYATGNFMDPLDVADWAYADGTYLGKGGTSKKMYPKVEAVFGKTYGFKVVNTGTFGRVDDEAFVNNLKNGGTAVVLVKGHYMAVVDYNEKTKKYLLWDNCAGDGRGGHRAGYTHKAGDWLTADQLEGSLNAEYLTVTWYCLIMPAETKEVEYKQTSGYDSIKLGFETDVAPKTITNNTTITLSDSNGMVLAANGWHGSTHKIVQFGYSVDGGSIIYDNVFTIAASETIQSKATKALGNDAYASGFSVQIQLNDNKAHTYKIYAQDGKNETLIWTINKKSEANLTENSYNVGTVNSFYDAGKLYGVRIYQNDKTDASYASGWGGLDGISNKTITKDATLFVNGAFSLKSSNCTRIGLLVDNSYIVWPKNSLIKSSSVLSTDCFLSGAENLGDYGFNFDLSFETSRLSKGSHVLKLVAEVDGKLYEIGTRTATYKGGCFVFNCTSSGSKYVAESTPVATKIPTPTPKATLAPASTDAPATAPSVTSSPELTPDSTEIASEETSTTAPDATLEPSATPIITHIHYDITEEPESTPAATENVEVTLAPTEKPVDSSKKGCKSMISGSFVILMLILSAGFMVVKLKKEN